MVLVGLEQGLTDFDRREPCGKKRNLRTFGMFVKNNCSTRVCVPYTTTSACLKIETLRYDD